MRRPTLLGQVVRSAAYGSFGVAFLADTLAPVFVGIVLLAGLGAARRSDVEADVQVTRLLPFGARVGQRVRVEVQVRSDRPLPLVVEQAAPAGFAVTETHSEPGRGVAVYSMDGNPQTAGQVVFAEVRLGLMDRWALSEQRIVKRLEHVLPVAPEPEFTARGRRVGARHTVHELNRSAQGLEMLVDVETVRPFMPGDRVRDIDWKRTSQLQGLQSRQRERATPRGVVLLVDATQSMRARRRYAKLATAARIAAGVAAAAEGAGVRASLVVFDEDKVQAANKSSGRGGVREVLAALSQLPAAAEVPRFAEPAEPERDPRRRTIQLLKQREAVTRRAVPPRASRIDDALAAVARSASAPALVVAIVDGEVQPRKAEVVAERLIGRGHDVVVVVPATGAHHYRRSEARGRILRDIVEAQRRRLFLGRTLHARGVPLVVARPGSELEVIQEVAKWTK